MDNKQEPDLAEALRIARSPAGKQLLELLRQKDSAALQTAVEQARSGNYAQARDALSSLLSTSDARELLEQLGGKP